MPLTTEQYDNDLIVTHILSPITLAVLNAYRGVQATVRRPRAAQDGYE